MEVLHIDEEKIKQTLLSLCEGKTFVFPYMVSRNNATFTDMKEAIMEDFCGKFYKRKLERKLRVVMFTRESDMPFLAWN